MRILVTGGNGQLGRALARRARGHTIQALGRSDLDVAAPDAADRIAAAAPDVVINAAAMTDVDGCEGDPEAAFLVNAIGARNVAAGAFLAGVPVVQI
ncbi:MAG: sugar nucleotide-binding protein, partial [Anaerolineae bacterium]